MTKTTAITLPYSATKYDLWRLSVSGGRVGFDKRGLPVFQFTSREQYQRYLELIKRRGDT